MPLHDAKKFDAWLRLRWDEKDALMEQYVSTGRFPSSNFTSEQLAGNFASSTTGFIETEVRTRYPWEFLQAFVVISAICYVGFVLHRVWAAFS